METVDQWGTLVASVVAALTFAWGVYQYFHNQRIKQDQLAREREAEAERRRIESTRPFLERQLQLYSEATRAAAAIAAPASGDAKAAAKARFQELFWGELAMVESLDVEQAMIAFREGLKAGLTGEAIGELSVLLAHACRDSLARSWNTKAWQSHYTHPARDERENDDRRAD